MRDAVIFYVVAVRWTVGIPISMDISNLQVKCECRMHGRQRRRTSIFYYFHRISCMNIAQVRF